MNEKSFEICIDHHKKLIDGGIIRESDCYNHVTTMVQYTTEKSNKPTNKVFVCSSHGSKPKINSYRVIFITYYFLISLAVSQSFNFIS